MGARGPLPKDPAFRKRKNRPAETTKLQTQAEAAMNRIPPMPSRAGKNKWAISVQEWWKAIWKSPMAAMWLPSDVAGILPHLCSLHQFAVEAKSPNELLNVLSAIKMQEARLGLSPSDRLRLRWDVPTEENAEAIRQNPSGPEKRPWEVDEDEGKPGDPPVDDPRSALSVSSGGLDKRKKQA